MQLFGGQEDCYAKATVAFSTSQSFTLLVVLDAMDCGITFLYDLSILTDGWPLPLRKRRLSDGASNFSLPLLAISEQMNTKGGVLVRKRITAHGPKRNDLAQAASSTVYNKHRCVSNHQLPSPSSSQTAKVTPSFAKNPSRNVLF